MSVGTNLGDRDITVPQFFTEAQPDEEATRKTGVPQFKNVQMIRIIMPGIRDEVVRPVEARDKERYSIYWQRYEQGLKHEVQGTPLTEFATATEAERAQLRASGIQTVEQIAELNDDACQKLHAVALRNKAQKFLLTLANIGNVAKLEATIETLNKRIKELENANNPATVPGRNADNGVHPDNGDSVEQRTGRPEVESDSQRGGKRPGKRKAVEKVDL